MTNAAVRDKVEDLLPLLAATREQTERERRLAAPLVEALASANLFRLAVPRADGGLEASPLDTLHVLEALASVEAAAAWIVWNNTLPALMSRYLAAPERAALFGSSAHITANSTRPTGQALREHDGVRVNGRWSLVSGCELADQLLLRAVVVPPPAADAGPPEMVSVFVPRTACRILDTWHASGLRGTGSHDVVVEDAWVARSRCVWFAQPSQLPGALYKMPFAATLSGGCASLCLGIASGALRALIDLAHTKKGVDRPIALGAQPRLLSELARMQAQHASAKLFLHETVGAAWRRCEAGEGVGEPARAQMFTAALHAAATAKQIVRSAFELAGASALYESCPIERAHRDIHAATQHIILHELWLEEAGRIALGQAPLVPLFNV